MESESNIQAPGRAESYKKNYLLDFLGFLFSLSAALPAYINSSFLSQFIDEKAISLVYAGSAVISIVSFRGFKDPSYESIPLYRTILKVLRNRDIFGIFSANFILRFFYSWMIIYTPLYLHNHLGFSWSEIGPMFTIMLVPFVLLEIPAGRLADSRYGEKEIMSLGFIIAAVSTAALSFIAVKSFWLWASLLFLTRVGASLIEITTESYFFKHICSSNSNTLSFFRMTAPLALIFGPLSATAFLFFFDFKNLFLVLG